MLQQKGCTDHSPCCDHKGWTWPSPSGHCPEPPGSCHNQGSLSHDLEGSCQSAPQGCQPRPAPQSCKPRRRVEVSPVPPVRPPPVRIHRRPLQQHRPCPPEPESCGKPRRRVEQSPEEDEEPPVVLQPLPHRCPCPQRCPRPVPCCPRPVSSCPRPVSSCPRPVSCCPRPVQRCCPVAVPLPSGHQQHKQVTLPPLCVKS